MAGENKLQLLYLANQLKPEHWAWAATEPAGAALLGPRVCDPVAQQQAAADALMGFLVGRLEGAGLEVVEAHAVIHDRDTQDGWDEASQQVVEVPKEIHLHGIVKFGGGRQGGATLTRAAELLGLAPQQIEKPRKGGRSVDGRTQSHDNQLAYLTHVKYPEKHQYAPEQVATVRGEDYMVIYRRRLAEWKKGRAHVIAKRAAENVEVLREQVLSGEVTRSQIMLTDHLFETYSRNQRVIDDALAAYGQRRAFKAAAKLRAGEFSTQVIYVHGQAGAGKTRFAGELIREALARAADRGERWALYRAATGNPLDDWQGEEVVLLDDLRASAMDANDWLLLLDPHNASPARARYRNKTEVAPRMIVLTATIEPVEFFFYARQKGQVDEALDQFIRRLAAVVQVVRQDDIERYLVGRVGRVEPYQRVLTVRDRLGQTQREVITLEHGAADLVEHSAGGAQAALLSGLAERSPDLQLEESADWLALEGRVNAEVGVHRDRQIEAAATAQAEAHAAALAAREAVAEVAAWYARRGLYDEASEVAALDRLPGLWDTSKSLPAVPAGLSYDDDPWPVSAPVPAVRFGASQTHSPNIERNPR